MAEKATGKKKQQNKQQQQQQQQQPQQQQQKNKKAKNPEKKKNLKNGVKSYKRQWLIPPYSKSQMYQKKKNKDKEYNNTNSNIYNNNSTNSNSNLNKFSKRKSGSNGASFLWMFFTRGLYIVLILGVIYIVDYEKFVRIRDGASYYVNKTVSLLPPEVLTKGKQAAEFIQPVAEVSLNKANAFLKTASSFLDTNPLVKDHWTNIREISSICSARLVDYLRTLYIQITGYCYDVKTKLFN